VTPVLRLTHDREQKADPGKRREHEADLANDMRSMTFPYTIGVKAKGPIPELGNDLHAQRIESSRGGE
jgi:hypothetical protein